MRIRDDVTGFFRSNKDYEREREKEREKGKEKKRNLARVIYIYVIKNLCSVQIVRFTSNNMSETSGFFPCPGTMQYNSRNYYDIIVVSFRLENIYRRNARSWTIILLRSSYYPYQIQSVDVSRTIYIYIKYYYYFNYCGDHLYGRTGGGITENNWLELGEEN